MKIIDETKLDYNDVLIRPKSSKTASRKAVELKRTFNKFPHSTRNLKCVPIMISNMDTVGTFNMANVMLSQNWTIALHKYYNVEDMVNFYRNKNDDPLAFYSLGIQDKDIDKLKEFLDKVVYKPNLCIDVANGYTDYFVDKVAAIRQLCPHSIIMAGNVSTPEMVERLIRHGGADIIKVGIGPGSVCTTRLVTGVGYPQLSAIMECADAAHGSSGGYICADGGCVTSGDICKAFGANADFVMIGGMVAGCDECEGEWTFEPKIQNIENLYDHSYFKVIPTTVDSNKKKSLVYYGMSSYTAQDKYSKMADHRPSEGKKVEIPYKGPVIDIMKQIEGGVRSCCAYIGADKIKDMGKCTTFIKVNRTHNNVFESSNQYSTEEYRASTASNC